MDGIFELLTQGTNLSPWAFLGLYAISFIGSFITASLGLGGGVSGVVLRASQER
jgi:hypothetical protein